MTPLILLWPGLLTVPRLMTERAKIIVIELHLQGNLVRGDKMLDKFKHLNLENRYNVLPQPTGSHTPKIIHLSQTAALLPLFSIFEKRIQ